MFNLMKTFITFTYFILLVGCKSTPPVNTYHVNESNLYWTTPKYINSNAHVKYAQVNNVDLTTFKVIAENKVYAKDKNYVYRKATALPFAEPDSFEVINDIYSKDKNYVFYESNIIKNAQSDSFNIVKRELAKDKVFVYFRHKIMIDAAPENIKVLYIKEESMSGPIYSQSGSNVYYNDTKFTPCDIKTFKVNSKRNSWSFDRECVYHKGKLSENIDPNTFTPISHSYGKDENNIYHEGKIVKFADISTFKSTFRGLITAKDNKNCFIGEKIVDCKDPIPGKKSKDMLSDMLTRMLVDSDKEKVNHLASQQETIKSVIEQVGNNYLTTDDITLINLKKIQSNFKWQTKTARTDYINSRYGYRKSIKQNFVFDYFSSLNNGVMQLIKSAKGQTLQEGTSFHIMGEHGYSIYQNGKCELKVGSCTETVKLFKQSLIATSKIPAKAIPVDITVDFELSYQNGVWIREMTNKKGEKVKEMTIYDKSTFPVYYSMIKDEKLLMEYVSDLITLP